MLEKTKRLQKKINFEKFPDKFGRFGKFGGRFVAETLMPLLIEVEREYEKAKKAKEFNKDLNYYFNNYVGRPSPLYYAERISKKLNGAKIYFKRDELNHTGAHKINNCIGQILLAKRMGKRRIVAETGAGQHGLATATVCALFNLKCIQKVCAEALCAVPEGVAARAQVGCIAADEISSSVGGQRLGSG